MRASERSRPLNIWFPPFFTFPNLIRTTLIFSQRALPPLFSLSLARSGGTPSQSSILAALIFHWYAHVLATNLNFNQWEQERKSSSIQWLITNSALLLLQQFCPQTRGGECALLSLNSLAHCCLLLLCPGFHLDRSSTSAQICAQFYVNWSRINKLCIYETK